MRRPPSTRRSRRRACFGGAVASSLLLLLPTSLASQCVEEYPRSGSFDAVRLQSLLVILYHGTPEMTEDEAGAFVDGTVGARTRELTEDLCVAWERSVQERMPVMAMVTALEPQATSLPRRWREVTTSEAYRTWEIGQTSVGEDTGNVVSAARSVAAYLEEVPPPDLRRPFLLSDSILALLRQPGGVARYRVTRATVHTLDSLGATLLAATLDTLSGNWQSLIDEVAALTADTTEAGRPVDVVRVPVDRRVVDTEDFPVSGGGQVARADTEAAPPERDPVVAEGAAASPTPIPWEEIRTKLRFERVPTAPGRAGPGLSIADSVDLTNSRLFFTERGPITYPDGYLFRRALRSAVTLAPGAEARVMAAAAAPNATRPLRLEPIVWKGNGCGCGVYPAAGRETPTLYGFFPFWKAPQWTSPDTVDGEPAPQKSDTVRFDALTRVAYQGVTFDAAGEDLTDPLHFKLGRYPEGARAFDARHFSDFARVAHDHKVYVDLVVYNEDWTAWLDRIESDSTAVAATYGALAERMVERIHRPLGLLDRVKPIISMGTSPRRNLGDGLTLDFDFSALSADEQRELRSSLETGGFFRSLRTALDAAEPRRLRFLDRLEDSEAVERQRMQLNLVVPATCVLLDAGGGSRAAGRAPPPSDTSGREGLARAGCDFFQRDFLARLDTDVNLFLIDLSEGGYATDSVTDLRARAQSLDLVLDSLFPLGDWRRQVIPLIRTSEPTDGLDTFFRFTRNLGGVGLWSVPAGPDVQEAFDAVYLPPPTTLLGRAGAELCDVLCPVRWPIRLVLFGVVVTWLVYRVAAEIRFDLRRIYETRGWAWFRLFAAVVFVSTIWCDPWWSQYQAIILLVLIAGVFASSQYARSKAMRATRYP